MFTTNRVKQLSVFCSVELNVLNARGCVTVYVESSKTFGVLSSMAKGVKPLWVFLCQCLLKVSLLK